MPITGQPYFTARSMTLQTFSANTSERLPPKIVKSWEKTKTLRPRIVPVARDDGVSPRASLAHFELDLAVAYVAVELHERTGVEELLEALPGEQLALGALPLHGLLGALVERGVAQLAEPRKLGLRRVSSCRHRPIVSDVDPWTAIDRSTIWSYADGQPGEFSYARDGHPTGAAAEAALGELEGGHALLFASGMAAAAGSLLGLLGQGQTVALAQDAYYGVGKLIDDLGRWGLGRADFDQTGSAPDEVDLVWLEAPSNPFLTFPDLGAAAAHGAPVIVDSTAATPVHLRPLEHGADFVLHSATKFLGGHHDLLLGVVVCRREEDHAQLLDFRTRTGAIATPDAAALLLRSLETLELRVKRQSASALELARRLAEHSGVELVRYPGLEPDLLAARYMDGGFGALLSFDVRGDALAVERSVSLIANATSLGGVRSTIESRRRWEGERVPEGLLRLSVGLEDPDALWADLEQALERG